MRVVISSPRRVLLKEQMYEVVLPILDGEISVLDDHQPFVGRLGKGFIRLRSADGNERRVIVDDGVVRMLDNELVIMLEAQSGTA